VAGHAMTAGREARGDDLQALDRRVDVARRAARAGLLAQHGPWLERVADLHLHVAVAHGAVARKAELILRLEPLGTERKPGVLEVRQYVGEISPHEVGEEEAVVERRPPAHERPAVRLVPEPRDERADEELLHGAHARV